MILSLTWKAHAVKDFEYFKGKYLKTFRLPRLKNVKESCQ